MEIMKLEESLRLQREDKTCIPLSKTIRASIEEDWKETLTTLINATGEPENIKAIIFSVIWGRLRNNQPSDVFMEEISNKTFKNTIQNIKEFLKEIGEDKIDTLPKYIEDYFYATDKSKSLVDIINNKTEEPLKKSENDLTVTFNSMETIAPKNQVDEPFDIKKIMEYGMEIFNDVKDPDFLMKTIADKDIPKAKKIEYVKFNTVPVINSIDIFLNDIVINQVLPLILSQVKDVEACKEKVNYIIKNKDNIIKYLISESFKEKKDVAEMIMPIVNSVLLERSKTQQPTPTQHPQMINPIEQLKMTINSMLQTRQQYLNLMNNTCTPEQQMNLTTQVNNCNLLLQNYYNQLQQMTTPMQNRQEPSGVAYSADENIFDSIISNINTVNFMNNQSVGAQEYFNYVKNGYESMHASVTELHALYAKQDEAKARDEDINLVNTYIMKELDKRKQVANNLAVKAEKENSEDIKDVDIIEDNKDNSQEAENQEAENKKEQSSKQSNSKKKVV